MDKGADFAFNLELDEALAAFLNDGGASSPAADDVFGAEFSQLLQTGNLSNYEQKLLDPYETETEAKRRRLDLGRQVHDRAFASQVTHIPEREWKITGANFDKPYGEGSSSSSSSNGKEYDYVVYVKGLVEQTAAGIGVAVCDCDGGLVFEVSTGLSGNGLQVNRELVAVKALVEALDAAIMLGSKKIEIVYDSIFLQLIDSTPIVQTLCTVSITADSFSGIENGDVFGQLKAYEIFNFGS